VGAQSVMTSAGVTPVVVLACWKNRRAASLSRREDAYTSMASSREGSHLPALLEPCVNLSIHTAPIT